MIMQTGGCLPYSFFFFLSFRFGDNLYYVLRLGLTMAFSGIGGFFIRHKCAGVASVVLSGFLSLHILLLWIPVLYFCVMLALSGVHRTSYTPLAWSGKGEEEEVGGGMKRNMIIRLLVSFKSCRRP